MIVLFKKEETYKAGGVFPVVSIPVEGKGEAKDFNDFQWWAPTDKWNTWLKANPRSWQAESEETEKDFRKRLYESLVEEGEIDSKVLDFTSFNSLLEADAAGSGSAVAVSSAEQPTEEQKKNYTKFVFAYNRLKGEGKIKDELNASALKKGEDYAIIWDLPGNTGSSVVESRQAYKSKVVSDLPNGVLVKIDESIPFGKFQEESDAGNTLMKIAGFGSQILTGGLTAVAAIGGGIWATKSIASRLAARKAINGGTSWLGRVVGTGAEKAVSSGVARTAASNLQYAKDVVAAIPGAGLEGAAGASEIAVGAAVPAAAAAEGGAAAASTTAAASNPIGWIIAAVAVTAGVVQRIVNWTSDAQAPKLGDIEDEGWAKDAFMPGTIPDGEAITICWTQDAGNSWFTDILWNEDTRTTMDLIKLGNFKGRSIFLMVQINSKEYDAVLKSKEMILLSFEQNAKFERGYFDNDDLEFEMIAVEKGESSNVISTIFEGYCTWEEMEGAYRGADDSFVGVPENAPDEYSFHYKLGKGDRDINVTGTLIKDLASLDVMNKTFAVGSPASNESAPTFNLEIDWKKISESTDVLSFSDFSKLPLIAVPTFEAEGDEAAAAPTDPDKENKYLTQTEKIAAYEVKTIEFADKALEDQQLPDLKTFIVPNNYLEATDNEEIIVQPIQDVTLKYPRRGTITVESEAAPEPVPVGATGEPGVEGGVPVEVTTDEVKIKYKDNPKILNKIGIDDATKIKDKDRDDKIRFMDMVTPEEKKELGMEDWDWIKKVKIYKDGKTGEPYIIKFKSGGLDADRKRKITAKDSNFDTALKVANRIQAGFTQVEDEDSEEK
jgi:hypothetical protein